MQLEKSVPYRVGTKPTVLFTVVHVTNGSFPEHNEIEVAVTSKFCVEVRRHASKRRGLLSLFVFPLLSLLLLRALLG